MGDAAITLESTPNCSSCLIGSATKQPLTSFWSDGKNGVSVKTCSVEPTSAAPNLSPGCAMLGFNFGFHLQTETSSNQIQAAHKE